MESGSSAAERIETKWETRRGKNKGESLPTDCFMVEPQPLFVASPLIDHLATSPLELLSDVSGDLKVPSSTRGWAAPRPALADAPGPLKSAHCLHAASVFDDAAVHSGAFFLSLALSTSEAPERTWSGASSGP